MQILYMCTFYHRAMIFRDSMNYLEGLGHKVTAYNAVAKGTPIDEKFLPIMDEKVIHKECFRNIDRYFFYYRQKKICKAVENEMNIKDYDLIHSHYLFNGGWATYRLNQKYGIPYVVSVRDTDINTYLKLPVFKGVARKIAGSASGIVFLSYPYKDKFLKLCFNEDEIKRIEKKCAVIPNGLESFWLENTGKCKASVHKPLELLCVSKLSKKKNIPTILDVVKKLNSSGVPTHMTVIGKVYDDNLKSLIENAEDVTYIPFLPKEELISYYRKSDIFVMPSLFETFGRVYAEAMTQGLPVIYTKGQGFDGNYPDGVVGYSVNPKDVDEIAYCIKRIINDYRNISKRCIENSKSFSWENTSAKLEEMYKRSI